MKLQKMALIGLIVFVQQAAFARSWSEPQCVVEQKGLVFTDYTISVVQDGRALFPPEHIGWTAPKIGVNNGDGVPACNKVIARLKEFYQATQLCSIYWPSVIQAFRSDVYQPCHNLADSELK